ncbi:MAG: LysR family transcriptional regulator [Burkholderiales bacterium]|nr:LysR family transcriptional regulator [Burkholderiales bacterium]
MSINISSALGQDTVDKRIDILQRIDQLGSISKAARSAGVSYKAAWQAIETLSNLAGTPLVEKVVGGASGGGAKITEAGKAVLEAAAALNKVRTQILNDASSGQTPKMAALTSSTLRMSIRNIIPAVIIEMHGGLSKVKILLKVGEDNYLRSSISKESQQLLGLEINEPVLALFKATAAQVLPGLPQGYTGPALTGQVARIPQKKHGGEVTLRLANGINVVGFVKGPHNLQIGDMAHLITEEQNIVIALMT